MSQRTFLTGLAFVLLAAQACGGDDGKKHVSATDAGAGGEAGESPDNSEGGSSAGAPSAGSAGEAPIPPSGGSGGEAPVEPTAGAGGEPAIVTPDPELLFSVKPGALGLANSGISTATNVQNVIYSSKTGKQEDVDGTNTVKITGESLGLAPTDQIIAFALLQPVPASPTYLFSVANGSDGSGAYTTRVNASNVAEGGSEEGDVYYTDGLQSFRDQGEGGNQYGYNAMLATETSLGLTRGDQEEIAPDDLTGLAIHDANQAITELYFAVSSAAVGADDTAVASTDVAERGCTVFKSDLKGGNSVAFTCAQLGLLSSAANPDQIDALAVFGAKKPTSVMFSVTATSQGAVETAVNDTFLGEAGVGSTLFQSGGDGQNSVVKGPVDLGLQENVDDEVDGLAVIDAPIGKATNTGSCDLTYDPTDAVNGGALAAWSGVSHIGDNVLVLFGTTNEGEPHAGLIAYDATTCEFLQQIELPLNFRDSNTNAIVPLAGWSPAKPFEKVEYWRIDTEGSQAALIHYDAAGTRVESFPLVGTSYYDTGDAIVYEPIHDRLYVVLHEYYGDFNRTIRVMPRPDASVTEIDVPLHFRTHPCGYESELIGTDPAGNLKIGASSGGEGDYRVCTFTPEGELLPQPYFWTLPENVYDKQGFFAADGTHFLMHYSPLSLERATYKSP